MTKAERMRELGKRGGEATKAKYGPEHYHTMAALASKVIKGKRRKKPAPPAAAAAAAVDAASEAQAATVKQGSAIIAALDAIIEANT